MSVFEDKVDVLLAKLQAASADRSVKAQAKADLKYSTYTELMVAHQAALREVLERLSAKSWSNSELEPVVNLSDIEAELAALSSDIGKEQ